MIKRLFEFILFSGVWKGITMAISQILRAMDSFILWITVVGWVVIIGLIVVMQYRNTKRVCKRIFAFKLTGKLFSLLSFNNPDYFPELNEAALKIHVDLLVNNPKWPFNRLIHRITLYRGFDYPYVFVVEIPDTVSRKAMDDIKAFENHWGLASFKHCVDDSFRKEVYRKESDANADLLLEKWFVWTNKEISTELVLKNYRWILYKK